MLDKDLITEYVILDIMELALDLCGRLLCGNSLGNHSTA